MKTRENQNSAPFEIALIYFSATGNTKKIADTIGNCLGAITQVADLSGDAETAEYQYFYLSGILTLRRICYGAVAKQLEKKQSRSDCESRHNGSVLI